MRLFIILSLLAIGSVHSYPYRTQLLSYSPARGEFPIQTGLAQGYLRYLDTNGVERFIGYSYPEPLYAVRRTSSDEAVKPLVKTGYIGDNLYVHEAHDLEKAREQHFREWCEHRYQALKSEIDKLMREGKNPSNDMMAQLKPLEKIISASTYTTSNDIPEIQGAREEHLRIWNDARLKVLQLESEHLRQHQGAQASGSQGTQPTQIGGGIFKTYTAQGAEIYTPTVGETAEQKKAREEHLRIYNELVSKQLEAEHLHTTQQKTDYASATATGEQTSVQLKSGEAATVGQSVVETPEVVRAREEHLRLWNEAKLRAEKDGHNFGSELQQQTIVNRLQDTASLTKSSTFESQSQQQSSTAQRVTTKNVKQSGGSSSMPSPAILVVVPGVQQPNSNIVQPPQLHNHREPQVDNSATLKTADSSKTFLAQQQQQQQLEQHQQGVVQETPEVKRAREEHLRLVNEANLKASQYQTENSASEDKAITYSGIDEAERNREAERIKEEKRLEEIERLRETERMLEEEKMREAERLREIERQKDEERMLETERLRLKQEEEQRMAAEAAEAAEAALAEVQFTEYKQQPEQQQQITGQVKSDFQTKSAWNVQGQQKQQSYGANAITNLEQYKQNPFLIRLVAQPQLQPIVATRGDFLTGDQKIIPSSSYILPSTSGTSGSSTAFISSQNPFLIRYTQTARPELANDRLESFAILGAPQKPFDPKEKPAKTISSISTDAVGASSSSLSASSAASSSLSASSSSSASSSYNTGSYAGLKTNYGKGADISELEKATLEHFRAHEIALEQLRLANLKDPQSHKDCIHN